jgi:erythromycin esterase
MLAVFLVSSLCAQSAWSLASPVSVTAPGTVLRVLDAGPYRGKPVRLSASVRLDNPVSGDHAQLYLRVVRPDAAPGFYDDMGDRPITSAGKQTVEIRGEVAPDSESIEIGLKLTGKARAWIDAVSFDSVPASADAATRQDLVRAYARLDAAYHAGDTAAIAALAAPDAVVVIAGERTPLSAILSQVASEIAKGAKYDSHSTVTAVRAVGNEFTATVYNRTTITSPAGSQTVVSVNRDQWFLLDSGWKLKESVLIATHLATPSTGSEVARPVVVELKQRAVTLPAGMAALGAAAGNARIVALGEASYGTREFADLNVRAIQDLVEHHGFTVVAIGANWAEARAIDDYVSAGLGDPALAIEGLDAWPWETEELLRLVRWMRDWNTAPGPHATLRFAGFDVQPSPAAERRVLDYLKKYAPEDEGPAALAYSEIRDSGRAVAGAAAVARALDVKHRELVGASSDALWRDAREAAAIAWQSRRGFAYRAEAMAATVEWLASEAFPTAKIVLWTHNANVSAAEGAMGSWLRRRYSSQLFTVGCAFRGGEVRAFENHEVTVHAVAPSPEGSGDAVLASAGMPQFFLDMRRLPPEGPVARWLAQPHQFHLVGIQWGETLLPQAPAKLYDSLIFVETSTSAQ